MASKRINKVASIAEKKCTNSGYGNTFLDGLSKMRVGQKLCDFSLDVQGEIIYVHKVALALASDYFASMFDIDMEEKRKGVIKLKDVDIITIHTLVEYIYSGVITLTKENVENLLSIADLFQILWVKEQCAEFLKLSVNRKNCFRIRKFADMHCCKQLLDFSHKYILDNFHNLTDQEDLLLLPFEEFQNLIKDEQRKNSLRFVESAYKASINWIKHDLEERKVHLRELMSHIRLICVSTGFLRNQVVAEPMFIEDQQCVKSLIEALIERCSTESCSTERPSTETKIVKEKVFLFLAGGFKFTALNHYGETPFPKRARYKFPPTKSACENFEVYDVSKNQLVTLSNMAQSRYDNSAISLNGVIYSVGGCDSNGAELTTAECYYPFNKKWNSIAPMTVRRSNFGICAYHEAFYVVGGTYTTNVEKYDPPSNRWVPCPAIRRHCQQCTRAALAEGSIYSFTYDSFFRFDPREGHWHTLNVMKKRPGRFELLSNDRSLFWIGSDYARFDIQMNKWEEMAPPKYTYKDRFTAVIAADNIYLLDGRVERYSVLENEWTTVNAEQFVYLGGAGAALTGPFDFN
ncbi:kelch-like protein 20 [Glossina fuscipes]|uniref:Kelch-like protein diablo n=1 Tax=Glossina fuscipes TaxID=7396 RepID=A0A9C5ZNB9_9MUSC|nr:kelch-like protein 20 [Glossina fuscipes]